jgi:hypothetical protein
MASIVSLAGVDLAENRTSGGRADFSSPTGLFVRVDGSCNGAATPYRGDGGWSAGARR